MIEKIITFSVNNKLFVGILTALLIVWGTYSLMQLPVDAVPDITNNQVQVITVAPNLATQEVEQFITFPVEISMSNIPGVNEIRSVSRFGLSVVTIVFKDDLGTYLPRQLISEKLSQVKEEIPKELGEPFMGPITTGLGEIYQYTIVPDQGYDSLYTPTELRTIQDWIVKRQLAMIPGVVEVNSYGGHIKKYEVAVDPEKLKSMNVNITEIFEAIKNNNENTGGSYIEKDHKAYFIRGEGLTKSIKEIENIVVKNVNGIPILVGDVAKVQIGKNVRYGVFTRMGEGEAVGGMIMMLKGANSADVIEGVKERISQIQKSLPEGLSIKPFIDRSELIEKTTSTVSENLIIGGLIVIFVLVLLLGNYRAGFIVASTIPLAMLFAFGMMNVFGVWINLMSLGAIDFGILVDGAVIIVEGIVFSMMARTKELNRLLKKTEMDEISKSKSTKMMNSAFFGQLIILIVYLPILALTGVEGKMFKPMAYVLIFAMIGVIILCFTYVPAISALILKPNKEEKKNVSSKIMNTVNRAYEPVISFAMKRKLPVLLSTVIIFFLSLFLFTRMGGEFLPQLDEGTIAFHIIQKPGSNLTEGKEIATKIEKKLLDTYPEIDEVVSRFGVSEVPTDPMPMDLADTFIILKPEDKWVSADSKEELIEKIKETLSMFPGVSYEFTQPIEMRFNELLTGVREDIAIKIYGDDLDVLARKGKEVENLIGGIIGVADLKAEAVQGLPQISINYDRSKIARYGIHISDINDIVNAAFGGKKAGIVFEGEKRFDLVVRLEEEYRRNIDHIKDIYIPLPDGNQIPLKEIAKITYKSAPMQISRENTKRRTYVGVNVSGRDVTSLVEEIKTNLDNNLELPPGYYIQYGGAFENFKEAAERLQVVVPIALLLIFILLYSSLRSFKQTMMIYTAIPLAGIGGVLSLYLRGMPFSISAGIGFIALFGVAVLNGLVLINRFNELKEEGVNDLNERILLGTKSRLRPILLTASTDILGFLPMAISTSAGAEVQRPLATVVIGGLLTSTFLTLVVLPILYYMFESGIKKQAFSKLAFGKTSVVVLFLILFTSQLNAQVTMKKINVDEAVKIGLQNYPAIKAAEMRKVREKSLQKTAWDLGDTELYYSVGETVGSANSGIESYGVKQTIDFPLRYFYRSSYLSSKTKQKDKEYDFVVSDLKRNIYSAYYDLLFARSTLNIVRSLDSVYTNFERAATLKYEKGETNKLEMINAIGEHKKIKVMLDEKETDYKIALENFNKWLNDQNYYSSIDEELIIYDCDEMTGVNSIDENPVYKIYQEKVNVKSKAESIEYAELLPKINFGYALQKVDGNSGFHSYQIGLEIPLWFFPKQGKIQEAQYNHSIASAELQQKRIELETELSNRQAEHQKISESLEYYKEQALPLADEQLEFANKSYFAGEINYVEYSQNIKHAYEIKLDHLELLQRHNRSVIEIKFLTGKF